MPAHFSRAMLSQRDKVIIKYCSDQGMPHAALAQHFQKTKQRIYQITAGDIIQLLPSEEAQSWFHAGIKAAELLKQWQTGQEPTLTPLMLGHQNYRKRQADLYKKRVENLQRAANKAYDTKCEQRGEPSFEEIEPQNETDDSYHSLTSAVLADIEQNLTRQNPRNRRYSQKTIALAYIIRSYSSACYEYLRKVLPLPSRQLLSRYFKSVEKRLSLSYETLNLDTIMTAYFDRHPLKSMTQNIACSLSIDAFSMAVLEKKSLMGWAYFPRDTENKEKLDIELDYLAAIEDPTPDRELTSRLFKNALNNVFLLVLNPLDWEQPSAILSVFSWASGHASCNIIRLILECIEKLKVYNVEVRAIGSDGDSGYNCLHDAFFELWHEARYDDLIGVCDLISEKPGGNLDLHGEKFALTACPIADPLHALKIARSRVLTKVIYLSSAFTVSEASFSQFENEKWFSDKGQLAKLPISTH